MPESKVLIAHEDVLPGAEAEGTPKGRRVAVDDESVYRLRDFGIARVERRSANAAA